VLTNFDITALWIAEVQKKKNRENFTGCCLVGSKRPFPGKLNLRVAKSTKRRKKTVKCNN